MSDGANLATLVERHKNCKTIFIIGGGPSLEMVDRTKLSATDHKIIVCNAAYRLYPKAMIAHHSDYAWWQKNAEDFLATFKGALATGCGLGTNLTDYPSRVEQLTYRAAGFPSENSGTSGLNTAQQALVMAHFFEPENIVMLGVDQRRYGEKCHWDGAGDWSEQEEQKLSRTLAQSIKWFSLFEQNKAETLKAANRPAFAPRILNVSPISAVTCYPKMDQIPEDVF